MKKITLLKSMLVLALITIIGANANAQGLEDFTNSDANTSYRSSSFIGNNGITWTYVASRDGNKDKNGSGITLPALMLRGSNYNSKITSSSIPNGIGNFSVKLYKGFTSPGDRQVELFINGVSKGVSTTFNDYNEHIFTVDNINVAGNIVIEIVNTTNKQIIIDDITWTAYAGTTPTITANPNALSFSAETGGATVTKDIAVTGVNLTADITATLSGADASQFSINPTTVTQSGGTANGTINVTYTPTATAANHTAQLTLSSAGATDVVVNLAGNSKEPTGTFAKITKAEDIVTGKEYIIYSVSSGQGGAMNNTIVGSGYMGVTAVTLTDEKIVNPSASAIWKIEGNSTDGYTLYNEEISKYCELKKSNNAAFSLETTSTHTYDITYSSAGKVQIKTNAPAGNGGKIKLSSSTKDKFLASREAGTTLVTLYKKEDPSTNILNHKVLSANAWVSYGKINFQATAGELVEIYTVTGQKVVSTTATDGINSIALNNTQGVLIVKVANRVSKIIL